MPPRKKIGDPALVVGYVRVSTEDQALSPDAQRDGLEAWCEKHGRALVGIHEDLGVSGAAPIEKRPGLIEALVTLQDHGAGILLVSKLDRLARDVALGGVIEQMVQSEGAQVLSCDGVGNADTPEGALLRNMIRSVAQYERQIIAARTRVVLQSKKRRGLRYNCRAPFGYRWTRDGRMEEHPGEQRTIAQILTLRKRGDTIAAIAEALDRRPARYPPRGAAWHATTVARILNRETASDAAD